MKSQSGERVETFAGLAAVLCWSTSVVTWRDLTVALGPFAALALIMTLGALLLIVVQGRPDIRALPTRYLWIGASLFVAYEICFAISIALARGRQEAIEVAIINYLWPTLTVLFGVFINGDRVGPSFLVGIGVSLAGVLLCMAGEDGLSLQSILAHAGTNPLSYGLAFLCAVFWALYSTLTRRLAQGQNGTAVFVACCAAASWIAAAVDPGRHFSLASLTVWQFLLACVAGGCTAMGSLLWNRGMLRGNVPLLALSAYATPVLSAIIAALWWYEVLPAQFWTGVAILAAGSVLGGVSVRRRT